MDQSETALAPSIKFKNRHAPIPSGAEIVDFKIPLYSRTHGTIIAAITRLGVPAMAAASTPVSISTLPKIAAESS
jgi:hypothetical protein